MTRINLLPWREELRKERQKQFVTMLIAGAVLGAATWGLGHMHYQGLIDHQQARNSVLQGEIKKLEAQIVKIRELETTKKQLISRMEVVQQLQQGRPQVVHLFHQLATTLPEGMYLTKVSQKGDALVLEGVADSNARVSSYMENLDRSVWMTDPDLDVIQALDDKGRRLSQYTLKVKLSSPKTEEVKS